MAQTLPDPNLIYCPPLQTYSIDKDNAEALSAGIVTFYSDVNRTTLKAIYQVTESTPGNYEYIQLNNPVTLTSIGTFADDSGNDINIFLYPYLGAPTDSIRGEDELYFIRVQSSGGVSEYTRSAYPPNVQASGTSGTTYGETSNQITNQQFTQVLGQSPIVYTVSGTDTVTLVAPGWYVKTSGSGTVTINQVTVPGSTESFDTNPPYALQISSASLTAISLYQRLESSPLLLSNHYIYGSVLVAATNGGGAQTITLQYEPSAGSDVVIATTVTTTDEVFTQISGTVLASQDNTEVPPSGHIDFVIGLQPSITFQITSALLVGVASAGATIVYPEQSTQLQTSELYWYDKPNLEYKAIPSYLVGWDFPLNPAQPFGDSGSLGATGANKSGYAWDQTILFQTVDNSLSFSRSAGQGGFVVTPSADTSFAMVQYLPSNIARELLSQNLSAQLQAFVSSGTLAGTVSMYWTTDATLPDLNAGTDNSLVSSITAGVPAVANGNWTKVPFIGDGNASFELTTTQSSYSFEGFGPTGGSTTATFFAIVIAFDTLTSAVPMTMNYCSLVGGKIATRPAAKTPDQTLRECQYYFESSYDVGVAPGTAVGVVSSPTYYAVASPITSGGAVVMTCYSAAFTLEFSVNKRTVTPLIAIFNSDTGALGGAHVILWSNGAVVAQTDVTFASFWTQDRLSGKSARYQPKTVAPPPTPLLSFTATAVGPTSVVVINYYIDARLGVIN